MCKAPSNSPIDKLRLDSLSLQPQTDPKKEGIALSPHTPTPIAHGVEIQAPLADNKAQFPTSIGQISEIQQTEANEEICHFDENSLGCQLDYIKDQLESAEAKKFISENSGYIVQVLYQSRHSDNKDLAKKGLELTKKYNEKVYALHPGVEDNVNDILVPPDELPVNILIGTDGSILVFEDPYYNTQLQDNDNRGPAHGKWHTAMHLTQPDSQSDFQYCELSQETEAKLSKFPLLNRQLLQDKKGNKTPDFIPVLGLDEADEKTLTKATKANSCPPEVSLTTSEQQGRLMEVLNPLHCRKENSALLTITDLHVAQIFDALGYNNKTAKEKSLLLISLAAFCIKSSSRQFLGTQKDSPYALREYSLALLNTATELSPGLVPSEQLTNWRDRTYGEKGENPCSNLWFANIKEFLEKHPEGLQTLNSVLPVTWS